MYFIHSGKILFYTDIVKVIINRNCEQDGWAKIDVNAASYTDWAKHLINGTRSRNTLGDFEWVTNDLLMKTMTVVKRVFIYIEYFKLIYARSFGKSVCVNLRAPLLFLAFARPITIFMCNKIFISECKLNRWPPLNGSVMLNISTY